MKNTGTKKQAVDKIIHDIRNPVSFIANNLSTLTQYVKNLQGLVACNRALIEMLQSQNIVLPGHMGRALDQLKVVHASNDFGFILKDVHDLANESLEGCQQITEQVETLQNLFK